MVIEGKLDVCIVRYTNNKYYTLYRYDVILPRFKYISGKLFLSKTQTEGSATDAKYFCSVY